MIMILVLISCMIIICDVYEIFEFISIIIRWLKYFILIYIYNMDIMFDIFFEL